MSEILGLDAQIETLLSCKPLPEQQVKQLCERVSSSLQPSAGHFVWGAL